MFSYLSYLLKRFIKYVVTIEMSDKPTKTRPERSFNDNLNFPNVQDTKKKNVKTDN